jgi:hypothetical protein
MELALCVIGQMASREELRKSIGFGAGFRRKAGAPRFFLVHCYLDRCGVAEVA